MLRIKIKNFVIDPKSQQPLLILQTVKGRRNISIYLSVFDLPKVMSVLYKFKEDDSDIHHVFGQLFGLHPFLRPSRIVIMKKEDFACLLEYRVLFFFRRAVEINVTDGVILSMLSHIPLYAATDLFREHARTAIHEQKEQLLHRNLLEKWDPQKTNVQVN
jgi:hypothetical protein